jgi:hypothetical protein
MPGNLTIGIKIVRVLPLTPVSDQYESQLLFTGKIDRVKS